MNTHKYFTELGEKSLAKGNHQLKDQNIDLVELERQWICQWHTIPFPLRRFVLRNHDQDMGINDLVAFWSSPENAMAEYTRGEEGRRLCDAIWVMAKRYLPICSSKAGALVLNGSFVRQCLKVPLERIAKMCQQKIPRAQLSAELPLLSEGLCAIQTDRSMQIYVEERYPLSKKIVNLLSHGDLKPASTNKHHHNRRKKSGKAASKGDEEIQIELILEDSMKLDKQSFNISSSMTFKTLFKDYAEKRDVSLRDLRFSYQGSTLFLSQIGGKTPACMSMSNQDVITVCDMRAPQQEARDDEEVNDGRNRCKEGTKAVSPKRNKSMRSKKSKGDNNRRRVSNNHLQYKLVKTMNEYKSEHSKLLTKLHEEVQPQLKEIRNRLNVMDIKCQAPKEKKLKRRTKDVKEVNARDDLLLRCEGVGGKAGKPYFIVNVGEVENLYKTTKPCHYLMHSHDALMIDLHGLTVGEAMNTLNEALPKWVNAAMKREYPFVATVKIVCGCGNQILSEAVQKWIKSKRNVSNAPKSSY